VSAAPDLFEPLLAWRSWFVVDEGDGARLASPLYHTVWPICETLAAECEQRGRYLLKPWRKRPPRHEAPDEPCTCGIYALSQVEPLRIYVYPYDLPRKRILQQVVGRVALWGTVVEYEAGWRASMAYPDRLYLPAWRASGAALADIDDVALGLADYRVPVEIVDETPRGAISALAHRPDMLRNRQRFKL
jgi:hypothetical protein